MPDLVDGAIEDVGGIVGVVEVADFVNDQDVGLDVFGSDFAELAAL